ncbi:uncharacterized protein LOC119465199 isoform X4 [Dermacentor silvarum]|uniref:uncharacterized protein LOC119465199 isoform X4 n=1 Tax=Dermacentor silvarum TaxID=543639 RepID=UPI002100C121|nr:uncharacterized protein LOC119465199 isoform X4 [Dermacentor silvarum]
MASQGKRYTLCGFDKELDWRPLHFVERVPAQRICNACGVLPRSTVFLPCRHVLCQSCYEQCLLDDGHSCLLDGDQFLSEEAEWRDFPLENLLKRKVHKGVIDEFLPWPFNEKILLTVKHPSRQKQRQFIEETGDLLGSFGRPQESSNNGVRFVASSVCLDDLEREGYITDDNLQIVWELVPKDFPK